MRDERTPDTYFQQTDKTREALNNIVKRLDDLKSKLQHLTRRGGTKAHKVIINKEIEEGKNKFYRELSRKQIDRAITHFILEDTSTAVSLLKNALDTKIHMRLRPTLERTGKSIQQQVFRQ